MTRITSERINEGMEDRVEVSKSIRKEVDLLNKSVRFMFVLRRFSDKLATILLRNPSLID